MKKTFVWGSGLSPFFTPEDFLPSHPSVKENLETEVLIIGGGVSGLLCAYELIRSGKQVVLVTENTVGDGASRFSTGMICGDGGVDLSLLQKNVGRKDAVAWYQSAASAVPTLERIVAETGSRCDFQKRDLFYYTEFPKESDGLRDEYLLRHHVGVECRWIPEDDCREAFSFPCVCGIRSGGAELNTVKFCWDLADWITLRGGAVYEGSRVNSIETVSSERYVCRLDSGTVTAKFVVDARGGEVLRKRPQLGRRGTVFSVVTQPIPVFRGWPDRCLIKSHDSFLFLRTTEDGRIVISGHVSSALSPDGRIGSLDVSALCRVKYRNLEEELQDMFVGIPRIKTEFAFTQGTVFSRTGLPYVGRDGQWEGLYYLYAFGESGMTGALICASRICRMICDRTQTREDYLSL